MVAALVAMFAPACGDLDSAGAAFRPRRPGVLSVATAVADAPGFWETAAGGDDPGGFEGALAAELAERLDLKRVEVRTVPFADIAAGRLGGADLALSQMTPTPERERVVDFTTPYLTAPPAALVRAGTAAADEPVDAARLRELRWVVTGTSTLTAVVAERIRPEADPLVVATRAEQLDALGARRADAVLLDLPVALAIAGAQPRRFAVLGQLAGDEGLAAVLPEGSPNLEAVDSAIRALERDGTLEGLAGRWLGTSAEDIPLIRTDD